MVQEEVARRFTAAPKTANYSSFTVFLNFYTAAHYGFTVNRTCFYPSPSVDSAIVLLDLKKPPKVSSEEGFFNLTRGAFGHRRKMLRASLRPLYDSASVETALAAIGQNPLARPEDLSLDEFIKLFELLTPNLKDAIDKKQEQNKPRR
jgi:16S rRNA (adenine1518-N6/adenine1519-N6)-dimethyltransferase